MAQDDTSPKKPSKASKAPKKSAVLHDEPARALATTPRPDELKEDAHLPGLSGRLNPPWVTSEGVIPNPIQLTAVPELREDDLELLRLVCDLRDHKKDLNEAMTNAAILYWRDHLARQQEHMGTGERKKVVALKKLVRATLKLLKDPKLRNRLCMAEPPITFDHWELLSADEKVAVTHRWHLDTISFRQRRPAFFGGPVDSDLIGDLETQMATNLKGDTAKVVERQLGELEALAELALKVDTTKPKGHHISLRRAASCLGQFWIKIGRKSTSLVSGGEASDFAYFLSRCLTLIAKKEISADVVIRACSPKNARLAPKVVAP